MKRAIIIVIAIIVILFLAQTAVGFPVYFIKMIFAKDIKTNQYIVCDTYWNTCLDNNYKAIEGCKITKECNLSVGQKFISNVARDVNYAGFIFNTASGCTDKNVTNDNNLLKEHQNIYYIDKTSNQFGKMFKYKVFEAVASGTTKICRQRCCGACFEICDNIKIN
ncbi:MAG: hypothetical protein WCV92_04425 [Candidatus Buchananbacteria bacterium]